MKPLDDAGFRDWRTWVVARASGRVLEIGVGTGLNFPHYPPSAEVFAFDPDRAMLDEIEDSHSASPNIHLVQAEGESLPFADACFDSAVGTLVMCTVRRPAQTLAELRRVLKPGAPFRLVEHVRPGNSFLGFMSDAATPIWKRMAGGCHLNRDTLSAVRSAGFQVLSVKKRWRGLFVGIDAER